MHLPCFSPVTQAEGLSATWYQALCGMSAVGQLTAMLAAGPPPEQVPEHERTNWVLSIAMQIQSEIMAVDLSHMLEGASVLGVPVTGIKRYTQRRQHHRPKAVHTSYRRRRRRRRRCCCCCVPCRATGVGSVRSAAAEKKRSLTPELLGMADCLRRRHVVVHCHHLCCA